MSCKHKTYTVYQEVNGEGLRTSLDRNPPHAPDPHSNYTEQLGSMVRAYLRDNSEAQPPCGDGCRSIGFEETHVRRFPVQPRWLWHENYFDTSENPPVRKVAAYVAVGNQEISQVIRTVFCAPVHPVLQSACLPDGQQVDWEITALATALSDRSGTDDVNAALLSMEPLTESKKS